MPRLVEVWEAAVRATHHFLTEEDIAFFRTSVRTSLFGVLELACVRDEHGTLMGFVGTSGDELSMLFVHPAWHGRGVGRRLVQYAIERCGARRVDANEQNPGAVGFYLHLGFVVEGRSERDGLGKPFPLLHLRLPDQARSR